MSANTSTRNHRQDNAPRIGDRVRLRFCDGSTAEGTWTRIPGRSGRLWPALRRDDGTLLHQITGHRVISRELLPPRPGTLAGVLARAYDQAAAERRAVPDVRHLCRWAGLSWRQKQLVRVMWQAAAAGQRDPARVAEAGWARDQEFRDTDTGDYREREPDRREQFHLMATHLVRAAETHRRDGAS